MSKAGVIITGLASSTGKTLTTLGLLRALKNQSIAVSAAKTGPDYIDPGFHEAASGQVSVNLDGFAMTPQMLAYLAARQPGDLLVIEGVMGLYDGGAGSAVSLAQHLHLPLILVMDCRGQAETTGALAAALKERLAEDSVDLAGVILNRLSSARHGNLIAQHCADLGIPVMGRLFNRDDINMPSRHLGLVQSFDLAAQGELDRLLEIAGQMMAEGLDLASITAAAKPMTPPPHPKEALPPPGQRIAVAYDAAFGFAYAHLLQGWQRRGSEVQVFSPLADETPHPEADFVFLPGGYPELHIDALTAARNFRKAMTNAAERNIPIYGECGGYMVLGQRIIDAKGQPAPMLGLLDLETSFAHPKRVLGYRHLTQINTALPFWPEQMKGHEFHFTTAISAKGQPLFNARDKDGKDLGDIGLVQGRIAGSYAHIIAAS